MKYVLIGNNDYLIDPVTCVLKNRGVEDIDAFLNVNQSSELDYNLLDNIDKAVTCVVKHLKANSNIHVLVDSDFDGYSGAATIVNYLKKVKPDVEIGFTVHTGKEHGLSNMVDQIPADVNLLIIPDAGSRDYTEHKILADKGIDIIVLDHHKCNQYSEHAIVVNNQMCNYSNKALSGVGIVYKFCKAMDNANKLNYADEFLDLVACGQIADLMDTRSLETRYYIQTGLKKFKNPFLIALAEKQSFSMKGVINNTTVAFYIVPLINACVRFGTQEEKINMFHAFIGSDLYFEYQGRAKKGEAKPSPVMQHVSVMMARACVNIKARQDTAKEKGLELIEKRIVDKKLDQNKVLIVNCSNILEPTLTGLVATGLANKYKRPVVLLKFYKDNIYGGSARGYDKSELKDFRQFLWDTNCFEEVEGHDNAFGIKIKTQNVVQANNVINDKLKAFTFDDVYEVDFAIPSNKLVANIIRDLNDLKNTWGYGVGEPKIAIVDILISAKDIQIIGEKKNTLKFTFKGIEFIKFFQSVDVYNTIIAKGSTLKITVIGSCSMNEFNGNVTPQIIMDAFDVQPDSEEIFDF